MLFRSSLVWAEAGEAAKSINTASVARGLNNRIISASLPSRLHQPPISLSMRRSGMNQMAATVKNSTSDTVVLTKARPTAAI